MAELDQFNEDHKAGAMLLSASQCDLLRMEIERQSFPDPVSGCWLWGGIIGSTGYGKIGRRFAKQMKAHRASWLVYRGQIPSGLLVLHMCDVRPCVNPDHLFLGTHADNMKDASEKQRMPGGSAYGETNGNARLTEESIKHIRADLTSGMSMRAVARKFGISRPNVRDIRDRKTWKHIP